MASEEDDDDILALVSEPSESDELVDLSNSFSALLSASTGSDEKSVGLSPEEAAWVDSCLVLDAELSDVNWIAFTEALLDTLGVQNSNYEPDCVNGTLLQGPTSVQITERSETDAMYVEERDEDEDEDADVEDDEEKRDEDTSEGNANAENSEELEQEAVESRESIFKVWDLETLISSSEDEDDELIVHLKKLLIEGRGPERAFQQPPPYEPNRTIIDEVAANMADLSLRPLDD